MMACTDRFKAEVKGDHRAVALVELLDGSTGNVVATLEVLDGSVDVERRARVRRRATVTALIGSPDVPADQEVEVPPGLQRFGDEEDVYGALGDVFGSVPRSAVGGALAPYGTEFRMWRGVRYADGTDELVPLGVFLAEDVYIDDSGRGLVLQLQGNDRSQRISDARWTEPYVIEAGTNYVQAIEDLLASRWPGIVTDFTPTSRTAPLLTFGLETDNDPWVDAQDMAANLGCELFFDAEGVCRLVPEADVTSDPAVWSFEEGDRTQLRVGRRLNRTKTYNGVIVTVENPDVEPPLRAAAWDDNPNSPTYRYGPMGAKPRFYASQMITTLAQAQDVANALLLRFLGLDETIEVDAVPMPALDAGDVVRVRRARSQISAHFIVEDMSVPLRPDGAMRVTVKRRRNPEDEEGLS